MFKSVLTQKKNIPFINNQNLPLANEVTPRKERTPLGFNCATRKRPPGASNAQKWLNRAPLCSCIHMNISLNSHSVNRIENKTNIFSCIKSWTEYKWGKAFIWEVPGVLYNTHAGQRAQLASACYISMEIRVWCPAPMHTPRHDGVRGRSIPDQPTRPIHSKPQALVRPSLRTPLVDFQSPNAHAHIQAHLQRSAHRHTHKHANMSPETKSSALVFIHTQTTVDENVKPWE